jgi:hypothetical protein
VGIVASAKAVATASAKSSGSKAPRPTQASAVRCAFSSIVQRVDEGVQFGLAGAFLAGKEDHVHDLAGG